LTTIAWWWLKQNQQVEKMVATELSCAAQASNQYHFILMGLLGFHCNDCTRQAFQLTEMFLDPSLLFLSRNPLMLEGLEVLPRALWSYMLLGMHDHLASGDPYWRHLES
jgi:hypothetical protein